MKAARLHPVAMVTGASAGLLQLAGALKTAPPFAALPFDVSLAALAVLLPLLGLLAATRRWWVDPALALPLAAALALPLWLVVAGSWTVSREIIAAKLPEIVLAAPPMLAAGILVGAEPAARRALCAASLLIGVALAAIVAWQAAGGWAMQALLDPGRSGVHHQRGIL